MKDNNGISHSKVITHELNRSMDKPLPSTINKVEVKQSNEEKIRLEDQIKKKNRIIEEMQEEINQLLTKKNNDNNQKFIVLQNQFKNLENDYKSLVEENRGLLEQLEEKNKIIETLKKKNVEFLSFFFLFKFFVCWL